MLKQIINQEGSDENEAKDAAASGSGSGSGDKPSKSTPRRSVPRGSGKNILSSDVQIRGTLRFANDLIIDGRIEGEVNSEGDLTIGENAQILGDINTRSVVVFGKVKGNITVTDRCELKQNAELHGDVKAGKIAIEEGASFTGRSQVGGPSKVQGGSGGGGGGGSSSGAAQTPAKQAAPAGDK